MKVKLNSKELKKYLEAPVYDFPKYVTQILNLANQNAQGTRPKVVGQLTDLIQEFPGKELEEWQKWYLDKYPDAIDSATDKIFEMVKNLKDALGKINKNMVKDWVKDLVIVKTFLGLRLQEAVLKKGSELLKTEYRFANPKEESKGIDGFIGNIPVSIKPDTYKNKKSLLEKIDAKFIFYKKLKDGIEIDFSEIFEKSK